MSLQQDSHLQLSTVEIGNESVDSLPLNDIKQAIQNLSWQELRQLEAWFAEYFADAWDLQIEADAKAGKLDHLAQQAESDFRAGRCTPL